MADEENKGFKSLSDTAGDAPPPVKKEEPVAEKHEGAEFASERADAAHDEPKAAVPQEPAPFKAPVHTEAENTAPGPVATEEMPVPAPINAAAQALVDSGIEPHVANSMTGPGSNQ